MKNVQSELELIKIYQAKGYVDNFRVEDNKLIDNISKKKYAPNEIKIVAEHRFEGMSNPSDMSILYIIKIGNDVEGTFLASYGSVADTEAAEFFNEVPKENISHDENILM